MKLRIDGNSIRFRLSEADVQNLLANRTLKNVISFPNGKALYYILNTHQTSQMQASLQADGIRISISDERCNAWAHADKVGIEGFLALPNGDKLAVLIEKDLPCQHKDTPKKQSLKQATKGSEPKI